MFAHPHFRRGQSSLLETITRKTAVCVKKKSRGEIIRELQQKMEQMHKQLEQSEMHRLELFQRLMSLEAEGNQRLIAMEAENQRLRAYLHNLQSNLQRTFHETSVRMDPMPSSYGPGPLFGGVPPPNAPPTGSDSTMLAASVSSASQHQQQQSTAAPFPPPLSSGSYHHAPPQYHQVSQSLYGHQRQSSAPVLTGAPGGYDAAMGSLYGGGASSSTSTFMAPNQAPSSHFYHNPADPRLGFAPVVDHHQQVPQQHQQQPQHQLGDNHQNNNNHHGNGNTNPQNGGPNGNENGGGGMGLDAFHLD